MRTRAVTPRQATARKIALDVLLRVLDARVPLEEAWTGAVDPNAVEVRERGFARALVVHTLKRLGQIDVAIDACLDKPLAKKYARVRMILRLGAVQILFLRTPVHAAVNETVGLATGGREKPLKGLINAVLRRLEREGADMIAAHDAARLNTPDWLWTSWLKAYGEDTAGKIAQANLSDPPLDLSVKKAPEAWAERLGGMVLPSGSVRLTGSGPVTALEGYGDGAWWVQDAAAALPVKLLGDVSGRHIIDLCAAPGGKTAQLLAAGARVSAVDQSAKRLAVLRENLNRLYLSCEIIQADARKWRPAETADAVLLDAPCTGTGIIRRHPDIAWHKTPADLEALQAIQRDLIANAARMIKPGGMLIYATCSLQAEEGEIQARWMGQNQALEPVPLEPDTLPHLPEAVTKDGFLRTLPCHWAEKGGMDGFFAARFRRRRNI